MFSFLRRVFTFGKQSARCYSYAANGKTIARIVNKEEHNLLVNSFSQLGFRLNNNIFVMGPIILFPRTVLSWNIANSTCVSDTSLSVFNVITPKINILVLGYGDLQNKTPELGLTMFEFSKTFNINIEMMPTDKACATYNVLAADHRLVAAALIPPRQVKYREDDILATKQKRDEIMESMDSVF